MANEFKIRKGLIVEGASGGVVVNVLGSQGQLLSVTDDLSGSIFAVSDISGVPIFDVNSSGLSTFDGNVTFTKDVNITQTTDVGALNTTTLDDGSAVGLSLTYPTGNVAAGDGLAIAIGITGRGRSYIANSNTSNNLDASNLEFYTEGGGVINKVLTLDQNKDATFADNINVTNSASIGSTVAPTRTLDVRGSGMSIFGTGGYTELMIRGQVEGISTVRNVGSWHWSVRPDVGGDNDDLKLLRFVTGTFSGTAMQISNSTGNIGIGVNTIPNADYRLILEDTNEDILRLHNSTDGLDALISFTNPGGTLGRIQGIDNGGLGFDTGNNAGGINTNAMFIDNSGNVGINTTSPDFKLDVEGTLGVSDLPGNASSTSVLVQDQTTTPLTVVNGDFATDTDWTKNAGWTISGGKANVSGAQTGTTYIYQSGILPNPPENIEYIIKYTVSNYSAGEFRINVGGYISSAPPQVANGTYEVKVTPTNASSNTNIYIQANANTIGSVDTISVKQVTAGTNQIKARELGSSAFSETEYWKANGNDIYNTNSADVGIGTSGPVHKLDILTSTDQQIPLRIKNSDADSHTYMRFEDNAGQYWDTGINYANNDYYLKYGGTNKARFTNAGGLDVYGIGNSILTLNPGVTAGNYSALNVGRTDGAGAAHVTPAVTGGVPIGGIAGILFGSTNTSLPAVAIQTPNSASGHIVFKPKGTEKVRIQADGKVGIGATGPTQKLQLGDHGSLIDSIRIGTYAVAKNTRQYIGYTRDDTGLFEESNDGDTPSTVLAGVAGVRIVNTEGTLASLQADNSVQLLTHIYNGGSRVALHASYNGLVGIGTTSPTSQLFVNNTTDGDKIRWGKSDALVGSVGTYQGVPYIGYQGGAGGGIMFNGASIEPTALGSSRSSGTNDVGSTNYKWKDGWFNGSLYSYGAGLVVQGAATDQYFIQGKRTGNSGNTFSVYDNSSVAYINSYQSMVFRANQHGGSGGVFGFVGGKFGVGTASPTFGLTVSGGSANTNPATVEAPYIGEELAFKIENSAWTSTNGLIRMVQPAGGYANNSIMTFSTEQGTLTEKMRITQGGDVGIGTTTPNAKLDIQGSQGQLFSVTDDLSGSIFAVADISGVPIFDVNSNGKVGINTTSAADIFDVRSPSWATRIQSTVDGTYLRMSPNQIAAFNSAGAGSPLYFNASSTGNIVMATGGGAVCVGATTTPFNYGGSTLHVGGSRATLGLKSSGSLATIALSSNNVSDKDIHINHDGTTGALNFYQYSVTPTSARVSMLLAGNGYLGLGAGSATYPLDVHQASTSGVIIRAKGIGAMILIESNTAGEAYLYQKPNQTGDQEARFMMTANSTYGWAWSDDGSGTPASRVKYMKLDQNPGTLTVKGDVVAYGAPSDISLKENIKPIDSALDKVMKLQGVTFDWKKTDSILELKEDIGFIAQDVQKVVPELIRENSNGLLSMRHQGVAPILLEAIKELKAEIDLLKSKPCTCNKCNCNI
jgi:hypothetical protein